VRIRTVKPSFWANEKLAILPEFVRLIAIGLLNYADDHGFFWANSMMVRGSLFPFEEDVSKVRKGMAQLAVEGYIRLGKSTDGREVGQVINFKKHQRVDKPQPSEIQPIAIFEDHSENGMLPLGDQSSLERKGKEGKGRDHTPAPPVREEPDISAEEIYKAYPRKDARQDALRAITKAMKRRKPTELLRLTKAFAAAVSGWIPDDRKFVPHAATWFNGARYDDDPSTWSRSAPQAPQVPRPDIYTEPAGWREKAEAKWPGVELPATWFELSSTMRNDLLR
jgi:hypothetical protein